MSRKRTIHQVPGEREQGEHGDDLLRMLQTQYCKGHMTAKTMCELARTAFLSGSKNQNGSLHDWGLPPGRPTGHYQRTIDTAIKDLNITGVTPMTLTVPGQHPRKRRRCDLEVEARPMHELLHDETFKSDTSRRDMIDAISSRKWPRVYSQHHVVRHAAAGEIVVPCGVFIDGAQYGGRASGRSKSQLIVSLVNLATGTRHVSLAFRKHLACKCGCRGHCSMWPIYEFVAWCIRAMRDGKFPDRDVHDDPMQGVRADLGGKSMGVKGAVIYLMLDWEGICQTFPLPTWGHKLHCPLCDARQDTWFNVRTSTFNLLVKWRER